MVSGPCTRPRTPPVAHGARLRAVRGPLAFEKMKDFTMKNGDFTMKNGDFTMKDVDFNPKNGD